FLTSPFIAKQVLLSQVYYCPNCISNRQKKGTFLKPATHNLKPATCLPNPCPPHFGGATAQSKPTRCSSNPCPPVFWRGNNNLKPTRCSSNRNCKELK